MIKTVWIDKRGFINGKDGVLNLDNKFNLTKHCRDVSREETASLSETLMQKINGAVIVDASYGVSSTDYRIFVSQTDEPVTITLPSALNNDGAQYFIKAITYADPITITVDGVELINSDTSITLNAIYEYVEVFAINSQWHIVNSNYTTP